MLRRIANVTGFACLGFAVAVVLAGCGGQSEQPAAQTTGGGHVEGASAESHAGHDHPTKTTAAPAAKNADAYPLDVCVVSEKKLDSMGGPVVIQHEGRTVKFCCKGCEAPFKKDPATYLAKLDAAKKKAGGHEGHDH